MACSIALRLIEIEGKTERGGWRRKLGSPLSSLLMLNALAAVTNLQFTAVSALGDAGWNGAGIGRVVVERQGDALAFHEDGTWRTSAGATLSFKNVFRWTRLPVEKGCRLEHLRYGPDHPVFLFDLVSVAPNRYVSHTPHQCAADVYDGELTLSGSGIAFSWRIKGPRKDEVIRYRYF